MYRVKARGSSALRAIICAILAFNIASGLLFGTAVHAAGAVAQGTTRSGNTTLTSAAITWSKRSAGEARDEALKSCQSGTDKGITCSVVATFEGYCIAMATSGTGGGETGKRMGWAIAETASAAESRAMDRCKNGSGSGGDACRLSGTGACDPSPVGGKPWVDGKKEYPEPGADLPWAAIGAVGALGLVGWAVVAFFTSRSGGSQPTTARAPPHAPAYPLPTSNRVQETSPGVAPTAGLLALSPLAGGEPLALDTRLLSSAGVIVGRNPACDVVLDDAKASGRHARFYFDGSGTLRVEDLKSSNGTWRNDQRVGNASIRPGDIIRIGNTTYRC